MEIQAPNKILTDEESLFQSTIFLAGSIEMGKAENWQQRMVRELSDKGYVFYNPRRHDWDSSWTQTIENKQFREQVEWELNALDKAETIVLYFDPNTQSPISLLELGIWAGKRPEKLQVVCPEGFWRKGNVDIVCKKYGVSQHDSFDDLIEYLKR
jgi:hypothetical protein